MESAVGAVGVVVVFDHVYGVGEVGLVRDRCAIEVVEGEHSLREADHHGGGC
jgi:hypothetical protein